MTEIPCSLCGRLGTFRNRKNGTRYRYCIECQKKFSREHYVRNKQEYLDRNERRRQDVVQKTVAYLLTHPCVDCGETDPVVLDFDHVRGDKKDNISVLIRGTTWGVVEREVAKCDVRCANCHRRRTFGKLKKFLPESVAQQTERVPPKDEVASVILAGFSMPD